MPQAPAASTIRPLSQLIIDQIAAGEVVERPSSVVKELVENSLDAQATQIEIRLEQGGLQSIEILDNGTGMTLADLKACTDRHATSKLQRLSDLESLTTYGFRGEALSSIGSVASLTLRSRHQSNPHAYHRQISSGVQMGEPSEQAAAVGTSVKISELFAKIPARQKYMKSPPTEFAHCARIVREMAMGQPKVAFHVYHNGKQVAQYVSQDPSARLRECVRPRWEPLEIKDSRENLTLHAFLSPPNFDSPKNDITLLLNGRVVKNRTLLGAVRNAYQASGSSRSVCGVILLNIRSDWVDVNVHPQKLDVRLLHQESIFPWLVTTLRKAIAHHQRIETLPTVSETAPTFPVHTFQHAPQTLSDLPPSSPTNSVPPQPREVLPRLPALNLPPPEFGEIALCPNGLRWMGTFRKIFFLCEDSDGLLIVHQPALLAMNQYHRLKHQAKQGPIETHRLYRPIVFNLPKTLIACIEAFAQPLEDLGLELEPVGQNDVAVKQCPADLAYKEIEPFLTQFLSQVSKATLDTHEQWLEAFLCQLACYSGPPRAAPLAAELAMKLLTQLGPVDSNWRCPLGRAVVYRLGYEQIESFFERSL